MKHPVTKSDILAALESNARTIVEYFSSLAERRFFDGDPDHWSPAHHLTHLTQASISVERVLRPGASPLHPTPRSRTYAEVRDAAAAAVAATPKATLLDLGRVVAIAPGTTQEQVVRAFESVSAKFRKAAEAWSEEAIDRHALRHPLVGQMTVREMLYFFVVHERHHLKLVRTREERP